MYRGGRLSAERKRKAIRIGGVVGVLCLILLVTLLAVLIPKHATKKITKNNSPDRIECPGYETQSECESHGCVYQSADFGPKCHMPPHAFGYSVASNKKTRQDGYDVTLSSKTSQTPYGPSFANVIFQVTYVTENIVRIKLKNADAERYEVPVQDKLPLLQQKQAVDTKRLAYDVTYSNQSGSFVFKVNRKSNSATLLDTSIGGLVLSDQYLQIASHLPSTNIYGLGEHTHESLRHDLNFKTWPMFARDHPPTGGQINLYGVHPYYTCLENNTNSHGVLLLNSNAMEATLLPAPAISFRTIGGIIDLFIMVGENPEHVTQLYTSLIGRPILPPYWGLGFQLSRYGYNKLQNVKDVIERTRSSKIPQAVQYLDIDHMEENKDFTINLEQFKDLKEYIEKTKNEYGLKWIIIVDPAIASKSGYSPFESGLKDDVFVKRANFWKDDMFPKEAQSPNVTFGKVWPNEIVGFPDFFKENTKEWWTKNILEFHKNLPFDGLWTDMNEPSNFGTNEKKPFYCDFQKGKECWVLKCPESPFEDPPYNPLHSSGSDRLSAATLCMESIQAEKYRHYDVHSLYGWSQTEVSLKATEKATLSRSIVITRSTYPSSGVHAGHWLGDNKSTWDDMRRSIIGMLEFNMFGIPYVGADVCGFFAETTEELCIRWMQLGAFYPFFRNHNGMGMKDQDPGSMGEKVASASRRSIQRRYEFQPYLYTLFYNAHVHGNTVVRPLFHEFPDDENTWNIGTQMMWGRCVLISPVLEKGNTSINMYLPAGDWWHFEGNQSHLEQTSKNYFEEDDVEENTPMHVRGGCIIPIENYEFEKASIYRTRNISLYIFLSDNEASGELFVDDGTSVDTLANDAYDFLKFEVKDCSLTISKVAPSGFRTPDVNLFQLHIFKPSKDKTFTIRTMTYDENFEKMQLPETIGWENGDRKC